MAELKGTKTHRNLRDAFAGESMANRRYLYFAKVADVEGYPEIAGNFRDTAEGETGHAHGHLDYLRKVGDPATDQPFGDTVLNLKSGGPSRSATGAVSASNTVTAFRLFFPPSTGRMAMFGRSPLPRQPK